MKISRTYIKIGSISLALIIIVSIVVPVSLYLTRDRDELIDHPPIIIWNDNDFLSYNFSGDGSKNNPFMIQNLNITTDSNNGIYISGTTKYFTIKNCYIDAKYDGIYPGMNWPKKLSPLDLKYILGYIQKHRGYWL